MQMVAESCNITAKIVIVQAVKMLTLGIVFVLLCSSRSKYKKVYYYTNKHNITFFVPTI